MSSLRFCGILSKQIIKSQQLYRVHNVRKLINFNEEAKLVPIICFREYQQYRGFKNFGHKSQPVPKFTKVWYTFIGSVFVIAVIDWRKYVDIF